MIQITEEMNGDIAGLNPSLHASCKLIDRNQANVGTLFNTKKAMYFTLHKTASMPYRVKNVAVGLH